MGRDPVRLPYHAPRMESDQGTPVPWRSIVRR